MEVVSRVVCEGEEFAVIWCSTVDERRSFIREIEDVVSNCRDDFIPYEGYYSEGVVDLSFFDNYSDSSEDVLVVGSEDDVIGFCSFEAASVRSDVPVSESSFGYLSLIMVREEYRDCGIGRQLTECAIELLRDEYNSRVVYLSTWETNSRQFYLLCDEFGFTEVARKEEHRMNGDDTVYLGLSLEEDCDSDDEDGE